MHFKTHRTLTTHTLLSLSLALFLLSSCASQRWSEPLPEEDRAKLIAVTAAMQEKEKSCADSMDGNATIFWKTPVSHQGINGYLQLRSPSYSKFIISNPLGMVIYAFASDGRTFQILTTRERLHIRGNIRSLAMRKNIPVVLAQGDWFAYFNGRLPTRPLKIQKVAQSSSDETVWALLARSDLGKLQEKEWVHIDPATQTVLGYVFLDKDGESLAEIIYTNQEGKTDACSPKEKIHITDLPWGAEINITLQDIRTDTKFGASDFTLPVPMDYHKQLQP